MSYQEPEFVLPSGRPQFEEVDNLPIQDLLAQAPEFDESMAPEALDLLRKHVALRSLYMYALRTAAQQYPTLRSADTLEELKYAQGWMNGLEQYHRSTLEMLQAVEATQQQDEEDVNSNEPSGLPY